VADRPSPHRQTIASTTAARETIDRILGRYASVPSRAELLRAINAVRRRGMEPEEVDLVLDAMRKYLGMR
jgi:hypothetical protein